ICLILTGGTICTQPSPYGWVPTKNQLLSRCLAVNSRFNDPIVRAVSPIPTVVDERGVLRPGDATFVLPSERGEPRIRYTAFEFHELLESSAVDSSHWNALASCVIANYPSFTGFVVLHGTDTLAYTASALSFLLHPLSKPVVLTGSQLSIFAEPTDAWDNILGALHAASAGSGAQLEVSIYFHQALHRGNRSTKIHASEFAAFASPNTNEQEVRPHWLCPDSSNTSGHQRSSIKPFKSLVLLHSPDAAVLRIYPGISSQVISAILSFRNLKGLVLETFGAGHMPASPLILSVLRSAIKERNLIVVNVSQCLTGTVMGHYAPAKALEEVGVLSGFDMTTESAYTKLLWVLAQPD
ncbi:Asparaginase/glutaminase, partial [Polychaeton citri CBS 116435]